MKIIQYLINGISIGSVYAIIALGYTMVYGIAKMLNFAHGDVIMVGAYISFCVTNYLGLPVVVSILAAMAVCTLLGVLCSGGRCRCAAVLHGSDLAAHHRLHARYPRLYRRGFRRHRLHSRGYAGRYSAGRHRDLQQSLSQPPVQRRDRVCRPDCDPAGEACRSAGQAGSGEGMRWML